MSQARFVSISDAAEALNKQGYPIKEWAIRKAIQSHRFPHYRSTGGKTSLIPLREAVAMLEGEPIAESWFHGNPPALGV